MEVDEGNTDLGSLAVLLRRVAATPGARSLPLGTVIAGRYTIERFLGRGGMGAVYAVRDAALDETIALKALHPELGADPDYQRRLRAEVRLARRVSHPNVCRVHDLGDDAGRLFVTMELVDGESLRRWLRRDPAPPLAAGIDLLVQVCAALTAAHRAGVVHRDIKPDNVLVDATRAVLTDFGVATLSHDGDALVSGTPGYIAPEVLRGEPSDHRADVYAAAVLAYEIVTGDRPFPVPSLDANQRIATERPPVPPVPERVGGSGQRAAFDAVFAHALDSDPATRLGTTVELAEAIAQAARYGRRRATSAGETLVNAAATTMPLPAMGTGPTTIPTVPRRAELRVATALVYRGAPHSTDRPFGRSSDPSPGAGDPAEALERIVVDAGGTLLALGALGLTALFGVPRALGDDAERAARAAQALIERGGGSAGLDTVRVTLRSGEPPYADDATIAGAVALAETAPPGAVLATAVTSRQLAPRFDLGPAGPTAPDAQRVLGPRPTTATDRVATSRVRELDALVALAEDSFSRRQPRHGQVRAAAGYGKTRLRDAMIARLRERREIDLLVAQPTPEHDAGPLALLRAASPEWHAAAVRAGTDRNAVFAAARRWLETRAERCPVCLVVDDEQWADQLSHELLHELVGALEEVPVFIATFVRVPDDVAPAAPAAGIDVFELSGVDTASAADVVRELAPSAAPEIVSEVVRRAAGNPYFLEELAREVGEHGVAPGAALPKTVEAVVQARLDRLPPGERELLATAAVIGPLFSYAALAALAGGGGPALDSRLAELERQGLVAPQPIDSDDAEGESYRFVHDLVRDVAYARQPAVERRAAHAEVARWLARRHPALAGITSVPAAPGSAVAGAPGVAGEIVSAYAHHLAAAGDPMAAAAYRVAGLEYLAASAYRDAAAALRRSAALAPSVDGELAAALGDATVQADTIAEARVWYRRAMDATPADDAPARALLWHKLGAAATRGGDNPEALACFEAGIALVAPDGELAPWAALDPRTAALLYGSYGWVAGYMLADNDRGLAACRRAVDLLEGTPHRRALAQALSRLGATLMRANRFREQLECNRRNLAIGIEISDLMMQLTARINLGVVLGVLGEIDEAIAHTERARGLVQRTGARAAAGLIESNLAGLYLELGRIDEAERGLAEALAFAERVGARAGLTETHGYMARVRAARGDLVGAARWATQSRALAESLGLRLDRGIAQRLLAQIHARAGDHAAARATVDDAEALLTGVDDFELARTVAARARILALAGDTVAADAARATAHAAFTAAGARRELAVIDDLDEVR